MYMLEQSTVDISQTAVQFMGSFGNPMKNETILIWFFKIAIGNTIGCMLGNLKSHSMSQVLSTKRYVNRERAEFRLDTLKKKPNNN